MAKVQHIQIVDELKTLYDKSLEVRDRFVLGVVQAHKRELSREQKRILKRTAQINSPQQGRGSMLKYLSPIWKGLTPAQRTNWKNVGALSGISGWQMFVSDCAQRIKRDIVFPVLPVNTWQVFTGIVSVQAPDTGITLVQEHPRDYYTASKLVGKSYKKGLFFVRETFSLPITFSLSYKSDLSPVGSAQDFRIFARVWHSYQAEDLFTDLDLAVSPFNDWSVVSATLEKVKGILISYVLVIHISGYTGRVLFDNIKLVHSGTNWARDTLCNEINKTFTKAFAVVPPHWVAVDLGAESSFFSDYPALL